VILIVFEELVSTRRGVEDDFGLFSPVEVVVLWLLVGWERAIF